MSSPQNQSRLLPFEFAQQHGVLWDGESLSCRQQPTLPVLLELRRVLGAGLHWQLSDQATFQQNLTRLYQGGADAAQRAAEDLMMILIWMRWSTRFPNTVIYCPVRKMRRSSG